MHPAERAAQHRLEQASTFVEGLGAQVAIAEGQQVEGHEAGGKLGGQLAHARFGWVQPQLEAVEVESVFGDHDHLAVDDAALR